MAARVMSQPGPTVGRGPGRPFYGQVERTPALWISWIKDICKTTSHDIEQLGLTMYDHPIEFESVELTFGTRHYFVCPRCRRRCEALYFVGTALCRKCARLGYHSQFHRPNSALGDLCRLYTRRGFWRNVHGSRVPCNRDKDLIMKLFRETLEKHFMELIECMAFDIEFGAKMERLKNR